MTANLIPIASATYCDDFRQEVGGKFSLMGIYSTELIISAMFPVTLPKLCVFMTYAENLDAAVKRKGQTLSFRIYLPGEPDDRPVGRIDFAFDDLVNNVDQQEAAKYVPEEKDIEKVAGLRVPYILSPLNLEREGLIRTRMVIGDETFKMGSLRVVSLASRGEMPQPGGSS